MVSGDEVAAGVADDGDVEVLESVDDIGAEAVGVGQGVSGIIDAAVDAAAHVPGDCQYDARADGLGRDGKVVLRHEGTAASCKPWSVFSLSVSGVATNTKTLGGECE